MLKDLLVKNAVSEILKAGPYIGPHGGKYSDPAHKIPWKEGSGESSKQVKELDSILARSGTKIGVGKDHFKTVKKENAFYIVNEKWPVPVAIGSNFEQAKSAMKSYAAKREAHNKKVKFKEKIKDLKSRIKEKKKELGDKIIQKAGGAHKYVRREGSKGKYKYWYRDPKTGKEYTGKKPTVGTHHEKDAQNFVKHEDGWVHIGGYNHGKLKGKKESKQEHKDFAKEEYEKMYPETKEKPVDTSEIKGEARNEAKKEDEKMKEEEYEFARDSKNQNEGEDLMESARHKRNAWKGLDDAENRGLADELVNRKTLIKNDSPDIISNINKSNVNIALAGYFAMKRFPANPEYPVWMSKMKDSEIIDKVKLGEVEGRFTHSPRGERARFKDADRVGSITVGEYKKEIRKQYVDVYDKMKTRVNSIVSLSNELKGEDAGSFHDPAQMTNHLRTIVKLEIDKMRKFDLYNPILGSFAGLHNTGLDPMSYGAKTSAFNTQRKFMLLAKGAIGHKDNNYFLSNEYRENAKKVIEGKSMDSVWGVSKEKVKKVSRAEMYITDEIV